MATAFYRAILALCYAKSGILPKARQYRDRAISECEVLDQRWLLAPTLVSAGEVELLLAGHYEQLAETYFERAISVARQQSAKTFELAAAMSLCQLWTSQGKRTEAGQLLTPVYEWFTEGLNTPVLKQAKTLLDELRPTI